MPPAERCAPGRGHRASSTSGRRSRASTSRNTAAGRHPVGGPTGCLNPSRPPLVLRGHPYVVGDPILARNRGRLLLYLHLLGVARYNSAQRDRAVVRDDLDVVAVGREALIVHDTAPDTRREID